MLIDHVTIRTADIEATSAFFEDIFDLERGSRPAAIRRIPGYWLYSRGRPLVHVIGAYPNRDGEPTEAIDHVGFRLDDYRAFRATLDDRGIAYSLQDLPDIKERRVFLRAPGGPLLEVVFGETSEVDRISSHAGQDQSSR